MKTALLGVCLALLVLPMPADAAFPGQNGKIAFVRDDNIWTMNADGTDQVDLTNSSQLESDPAWSPDGKRIAFIRSFAEVWVMDADGNNQQAVANQPLGGPKGGPSWSPDGTKLSFAIDGRCETGFPGAEDGGVWTINTDGTGLTQLGCVHDGDERGYDSTTWSPDGTKIAFSANLANFDIYTVPSARTNPAQPNSGTNLTNSNFFDLNPNWSPDGVKIGWDSDMGAVNQFLWKMNANGTGKARFTGATVSESDPAWSPDGTKVVFVRADSTDPGGIYVMNANGTSQAFLTDGRDPDWQPVTVTGYPRPRGASPLQVSLVPAYTQCSAPSSTHGSPLAYPSCGPPSQTSGFLTVGTPDANGQGANSIGSVKYTALNEPLPLDPNNGDQSDVQIDFSLTDVRNKSDLSDYTGSLRLSPNLRITDHDNGADTGSATVADIPLALDAPCAASASASTGASCTLHSTVEAFVPGAVKEKKRAIWELGQIQVYDGGPDGNPASADNTLFAVQGVFVP